MLLPANVRCALFYTAATAAAEASRKSAVITVWRQFQQWHWPFIATNSRNVRWRVVCQPPPQSLTHLAHIRLNFSTRNDSSNSISHWKNDNGDAEEDAITITGEAIQCIMDHSGRRVLMAWPGGPCYTYSYIWLRDSCQCPNCYHVHTKSRSQLLSNLDLHCTPEQLQIVTKTKEVRIVWNDGHVGMYPWAFLFQRSFNQQQRQWRIQRENLYDQILWSGNTMRDNIANMQYSNILSDDTVLLEFIRLLRVYGLVLISNASTDRQATEKFAHHIAFPMVTSYGAFFEVVAKKNPSNLAYTNAALGFHTDLPYYAEPPGIQTLHCLQRHEDIQNGENLFVDGFYAANKLREENAQHFAVLTQSDVQFRDYSQDYSHRLHLIHRHKTICLNNEGQFECIQFSNQQRDTVLPIENSSDNNVPLFFEALQHYNEIMQRECVQHTLMPGEMVVFDNRRVLHARQAFSSKSEKMDRFLLGFYFRWDEVIGRARRLAEDFGHF